MSDVPSVGVQEEWTEGPVRPLRWELRAPLRLGGGAGKGRKKLSGPPAQECNAGAVGGLRVFIEHLLHVRGAPGPEVRGLKKTQKSPLSWGPWKEGRVGNRRDE